MSKESVDRKWNLMASCRRGDPDLVYLWIGEWAFIVFAGTEPIALEIAGQGRWSVDAGTQINLFKALSLIPGAETSMGPSKPLALDDLKSLIADTLERQGGKVVQRWETEDGTEIVTIERAPLPERD